MSSQLSLTYPADYVGKEAWDRQLELIRAAVKHLTIKEVSYVLAVGHTQLADALHERDRKVWHGHWTHVLKAMLAARHSDEIAAELLRAIVEADVSATPYAITEDVELTPEEENALLKAELRKMGEPGKAALARLGKRGKR